MFENPSSLPAAPLPTPGSPEPKPATPPPPPNLPGAPVEDMFDKAEPAKTASMPTMSMPKPADVAPAVQPPMVKNRKGIVIASLVLGVVVLIGGGIALARFLGKPMIGTLKQETATTTPPPNEPSPVGTQNPFADTSSDAQAPLPSDAAAVAPPLADMAPSTAPKDSDGDGLNDDEEAILSTDVNAPDTDKDGLSDYDEVRVYSTDPINPDTDGDTYRDGDEVKNGYNPAGAGKIFGTPPANTSSTPPAVIR